MNFILKFFEKNIFWRQVKFCWQRFSFKEKITVYFLILVIVGASAILLWQNFKGEKEIIAIPGGTLTEGVVLENTIQTSEVTKRLTNCGLTSYNFERKIVPDLAESWQISSDGKIYTFKIRKGQNLEDLKQQILKQVKWEGVEIKVDGENLQFVLAQPYTPFLSSTTQPFFTSCGPFQIEKEGKNEIILKRKDDYHLGKPYLSKIVLRFYPDLEELQIDLKKGKLLSAAGVSTSKKGFKTYKMPLPYFQILFFNLQRDVLKDKKIRQNIAQNIPLDKEIELTLLTNDDKENLDKAEQLRQDFAKLKIKLNTIIKDDLSLQKEDIPTRAYDLLLYKVNFGADPDTYPFWHSSQISEKGMNLSSFSNPTVDKLLEEARTTLDENKRTANYQQVKKILESEVPAIFYEQEIYNYSVSKKVKGVLEGEIASPADRFLNVWQWYIKEKKVKK